ncbi:MAG: hypothetical protein LQ344_003130 [Seirophora lacunosa]|nr:MAG: hypothetical protein LQ344_003130 [Seirophora lacunosa]
MFAVPGWSVSASKLKPQQEPKDDKATHAATANKSLAKEGAKSKKRKRGHGQINGTTVTKDNVVELWQRHIEGVETTQGNPDGAEIKKSKTKRRRQEKGIDSSGLKRTEEAQSTQGGSAGQVTIESKNDHQYGSTQAPLTSSAHSLDGKSRYKERKSRAQQNAQRRKPGSLPQSHTPDTMSNENLQSVSKPVTSPPRVSLTTSTIPPAPPPTAKLTPLQTAMRAKLISARFRHINQTLYTTPSAHASSLFSANPEAFASYHAGFRAQVASWPQNPVDIFVQEIRERGASAGPKSQKQLFKEQKKKKKTKEGTKDKAKLPIADASVKLDPLPRSLTTKTSTILDLGCGDASLHASLLPYVASLDLSLHSFDLSPGESPNAHLITVSDIAHLTLPDSSADVAIFCLALMGTNWVDFVAEAARVVRVGGECWVGEVRSRFVGTKEVERMKSAKEGKGAKKKPKKKGDEEGEAGQGKIEVDEEDIAGKQAKDQETDVEPFVQVFRRRGFALKGDVDMGNRMFVRMRFVRIRNAPMATWMSDRRGQQQGSSKFIEEDETAVDPEEEAKVLKPCLYKTR